MRSARKAVFNGIVHRDRNLHEATTVTWVEEPGPRVRTRLVGGRPVVPIMRLTSRIQRVVRQRDVQVAFVVYTLLHNAFTLPDKMATVLQRGPGPPQRTFAARTTLTPSTPSRCPPRSDERSSS